MERMILLQDRALEHGEVGRLHGVPRYATSFVGRDGSIEAVRGLVERERMVTIAGAAGSGKTRLAAEAAPRLRELFAEGVWWIDLSATELSGVPSAFADALGIRRHPARTTSELVVSRLRGAPVLLVVDNCEHVADEVARLLVQILTETEPPRILATSREPVRVTGERVLRLPPLSTPPATTIGPDRLLEYEAARLLVARASAAGESVTLDERSSEAISAIVSQLDGLPLAIELAAGKLGSVSLPELALALESRLDLLTSGDRGGPPRQQTLEAAISWSLELLSDGERRLLKRLTVFPASFDAAAAEAVAGGDELGRADVLPLLVRLVDKSLVSADVGQPTRYRLLTTVRAFARDVDDGHDLAPAANRHRDYFSERADELFWQLVGPDLSSALVLARLEQPNLHAALQWSFERGEGEHALRLASALSMYWFRTGQLREWQEHLGAALELAGASSAWRARGLIASAWLYRLVGDAEAQRQARKAVVACIDERPDLLGLALAVLAEAQILVGELDDAHDTIERARKAFEGTEFAEGPHLTEELLGEVAFRRGDLDDALAHLRRSRDLYRELRGSLDAGWTLVVLAEVALASGEVDEAAEAANDAVADFRARGDPRGLAAAFVLLGRTYAARRDARYANELFVEARELAREWECPVELEQAERALEDLRLAAV
jgi:predicted ATPase